MRLFVAFDIPEETRAALAKFVAPLMQKCRAAKWARIEGLHVTLKFIGNVDEQKAETTRAALRQICSAEPVEMHFRGLGFFPNEKRPRVFWAGVETSSNTVPLAAEIDHALEKLGVPPETRPFTPHLTLARINLIDLHQRAEAATGLNDLITAARDFAKGDFGSVHAAEFHLFESRLKPSGAEYYRVETFPFVRANS